MIHDEERLGPPPAPVTPLVVQMTRIFLIQLRNNFLREVIYRSNFIAMLVVDVVWIVTEYSLFAVLYANTPTLVGWTQDQVFFFLGIFFASDAIFGTFFSRNFWVFSDLVNKGDLDILLTRPAPALFLALTRYYSVTAFLDFFLGIGLAMRFAGPAGFVGGWHWLALGGWLLVGVVSAVVMRFAFSVCVFWLDRSWAVSRLYYQFFAFATKPDAIYPPWIRYVILTVLPFAFIGSVPARAMLMGLSGREYLGIGVVLLAFLVLDGLLWRAGLKRYQSASS